MIRKILIAGLQRAAIMLTCVITGLATYWTVNQIMGPPTEVIMTPMAPHGEDIPTSTAPAWTGR